MSIPINVLLIEDSESDAALNVRALESGGYKVTHELVETAAEMKAALEKQIFDLIIADYNLPQFNAFGALAVLRESCQDIPLIVVSGTIGEETAVNLMKAGAQDYVMKGNLSRLATAVERELQDAGVRRERKKAEETLRSERIMLARTEGIAHVGSWEWDIATDTVTWSDELFRIFQRDPQEGAPSFAEHHNFYQPDDMALLRQAVEAAVADGTPYELELRAIRKDGVTRVCIASGIAEKALSGQTVRLFGSLQDITDRKQAEAALRENEEKYRQLFNHISSGVAVYEAIDNGGDFIFRDFNPAAEKIEKVSIKDVLGKRVSEVFSGVKEFGIFEVFQRVWQTGKLEYLPERIYKDDKDPGSWRESWVFKLPAGNIVAVYNDVTERKQAEKALLESEERLRLAINATQDGIWEWDIQNNQEFFSPRWCEIIGYSFDDPELPHTYNSWASRIHPDDYDYVTSALKNHLEKGMKYDVDYRHRHKSGEYRWQNSRGQVVLNESGKPTKMVGCIADITKRKQAELALEQSNQKLQKAIGSTIQALSLTAETRDPYTAGHQQRVAMLASAIAEEMGLPQKQIEVIRVAGVLHDVGKINIPSEILSKPGKLSNLEMELIKTHAQGSYNMLKALDLPWDICPAVLQHHERLDGSGYPNGLSGKAIALEARIMAVADTVEAMSSHRPYRPALGIEPALAEISKGKDRLYDTDVVAACLNLFNNKKFTFE